MPGRARLAKEDALEDFIAGAKWAIKEAHNIAIASEVAWLADDTAMHAGDIARRINTIPNEKI